MHQTHKLQLKQFLESEAGKATIEELKTLMPRVYGNKEGEAVSFESRALAGTERQAWEDCIEAMHELTNVKKQKPTGAGYKRMSDPKQEQ